MKQKTFLFFSVLFICKLFLIACSDRQDKVPPFLSIENKSVNFLAKAQSKLIDIKTNIAEWSVSVSPDAAAWLSATKSGKNVSISVSENLEVGIRKGSVVVTADNLTETILVEQLGQAPAILLSSDIFTIESTGGKINLEVTSNIEYEITIPAESSWIKAKEKSATRAEMVTASFDYTVDLNLAETERRGEIVVTQKNGKLQKKVIVAQKGLKDYDGGNTEGIKDDIKVPVTSGKASSFQGGQNIENSFDGDMTTLYHSNWNNRGTNYFPITLEYFFENQESIDYLVYYPRTEGYNGFFKEVEIWVATKENAAYTKAMDYDFKGASSATKVIFAKPLVHPTAVKFVIKSGHGDRQGFASCAEMEFYRKAPGTFDLLSVFSTTLCDELKSNITLSEIEKIPIELYRKIALYLYQDKYPKAFRIESYKAYPHPETIARSNKTNTYSLLDNPTGISVSEGEELVVFVGDTHGQNISIKVQNLDTPGGDGYGNASFYPLSQGMNKFTMKNKGLIYLFYHTDDYLSAAPIKVHFATGKVNGYFDSQKHTGANDWNRLLNSATDKYFDVLGKYAHLTFPTDQFKSYTGDNGLQLINLFDDLVHSEQDFMGLIKYDRVPANRAYFHVVYKEYMYATSYRTAYNSETSSSILNPEQLKKTPWGPAHELGHTHQTGSGFKWVGMTEVSNNVHSLYIQTLWGNSSRIETEDMGRYNNRYEKAYHSSFVNHTPHPGEADVFCKLVSLWQLQLYFAKAKGYDDFYKDFYERVRVSPDKETAGEQQLEFVKMVCDVSKTDMTDFFKKWGYLTPFDEIIDDYGKAQVKITQQQIDQTIAAIKAKNYPVADEVVEYICDANWSIFKNKLPIQQGRARKNGKTIVMINWKNVVAYEVYENDQLVFVSNKDAFDLDNAPTNNTKVYAVAYNGKKTEVNF